MSEAIPYKRSVVKIILKFIGTIIYCLILPIVIESFFSSAISSHWIAGVLFGGLCIVCTVIAVHGMDKDSEGHYYVDQAVNDICFACSLTISTATVITYGLWLADITHYQLVVLSAKKQ